MRKVAILRCGRLPSFVTWEIPNLEELFEEDHLLLQGFKAEGFDPQPVVWSHPDIDWGDFDAALIRSTWDYLDERERFLQVLSQIEASSCRLYNSLAAVRWNIDKHYLFDLERWGVPIVPTVPASRIGPGDLPKILVDRPPHLAVLKPTIGLGASHSRRVTLQELGDALNDLKARQPHSEYLVQPFIEDIVSEGEWSFVYFNRQLSHVLLKQPAAADYRVQGIYGGTLRPATPQPADRLQAESVMASLPFDLLYARLDFVRIDGRLSIMEVELIEPIFSFNLVPGSIGRLVQATRSRLDSSP